MVKSVVTVLTVQNLMKTMVVPIKFVNFEIRADITFQQILHKRKTKSKPHHTTMIDRREKKYHLTSHAVPFFQSKELQLHIDFNFAV